MSTIVLASIPGLLRLVLSDVLGGRSIGEAIDDLHLDSAYESAVTAWIVEAYNVYASSTINASDIVRLALRNCEDSLA